MHNMYTMYTTTVIHLSFFVFVSILIETNGIHITNRIKRAESKTSITQEEADLFLSKHNEYRGMVSPTASNMKKMMAFKLLIVASFLAQISGKLQEMTWKLDPHHMSAFPTSEHVYNFNMIHYGPNADFKLDFIAYGKYETEEHLFTHIDAPYHFDPQGKTVDEIPLEDLMGPLVRIDISDRASQVHDAAVTVDDLMKWENKHGTIPRRSFVLMYSGWDQYFGDNEKFIGSNSPEGPFHFPGFSVEAAQWLLDDREILGLGSDSLSCDPMAIIFEVHKLILPAGKTCVENLKNIGKVPECGARFMMLPIMLKNGTGAQGRAFAEWYPGTGYQTSCKGTLRQTHSLFDSGAQQSVSFRLLELVSLVFCFAWSILFSC